jgi:lactoylglutathione lyase
MSQTSVQSTKQPTTTQMAFGAVGIEVSNLDKSVDYYSRVCGMTKLQTFDLPHIKEAVMGYQRGSSVVLMQHTDGIARNTRDNPIKLVIYVPDPKAFAQCVRDAGFVVEREPEPSPSLDGVMVGFAKDPDGYLIEFIERRPKT